MQSDMERWFDAQFAGCDGWVELSFKSKQKRGWTSAHFQKEDLSEGDILSLAETGCDVYIGCCTLEAAPEKGRGKSGIRYEVPGVWLDLDVGDTGHKPRSDGLTTFRDENEALECVIASGLPQPTAVVSSGGGLYTWWLFDEPLILNADDEDRLAALALISAVATHVGDIAARNGRSVDQLQDPSRVLRPPGTLNWKTGSARPVELLDLEPGRRYPVEDLAVLVGDTDPVLAAPVSRAPDAGGPRRASGRAAATSGSLADAVRAAGWDEILMPVGWVRSDDAPDGGEGWLRPGKDLREDGGHSAVVYEDAPDVLVVFSDAAGLPSGAGKGLTKFRVMAHLHFDGNESRTARDLSRAVKEDSPGVWPRVVIEAAREASGLNLPFVQERGLRAVERRGGYTVALDSNGRRVWVHS